MCTNRGRQVGERGCEISDMLTIYHPPKSLAVASATTPSPHHHTTTTTCAPAWSGCGIGGRRQAFVGIDLEALQNDEIPRHARRTRKLLCLVGSRESFRRRMQVLDSGCRSGKGARGEGKMVWGVRK